MNTPAPLTEEQARRDLRETQAAIEAAMEDRAKGEADVADADAVLVGLRRRERDLIIFLTPERSGVPRVIRKA